jgi:hypothetical protein
MNYTNLYPGKVTRPEVVLMTGGIDGLLLSRACEALAQGCRAEGLSVSIATPGASESYVNADQFGDPADWSYQNDITLVNFGEYLGNTRFRNGYLSAVPLTRTVFFTSAAERSIAHLVPTVLEAEREKEVEEYVGLYLPQPVALSKISLISVQGAINGVAELDTEIIGNLLDGLEVTNETLEKRRLLVSSSILEQAPKLKRRLW